MNLETLLFAIGCSFVLAIIAGLRAVRMSRMERRAIDRMDALAEAGLKVPPTLHPVIDPKSCIGSASCTLACPQGDDVLGLISGRGTLVDPSVCIGHGRCAAECPTGAIRLVFGTAERGVEIPHVTPQFESNVPGLYIAGELGGMGLIANAVRQARGAMENIAAALKSSPVALEESDVVDLAIIGAGPAGVTAALWCIEHGHSYRLLERERTLGGSVLHYPRRKLILSEPVDFPLLGKIFERTLSKEALLELWQKAVDKHGMQVDFGWKVDDIQREGKGAFSITASDGEVKARKVLLSIGRRGTPRKLRVPGEDAQNVVYMVLDPDLYAGRRVLVVGGGDSAVEAACTIAEDTDATVRLSCRDTAVNQAKPENRARLDRHLEAGRIEVLWKSSVTKIAEDSVTLKVGDDTRELPNDDVVILIGGIVPTEFMARVGVQMERHFGEEVETSGVQSTTAVFKRIGDQRRDKGLQNMSPHGQGAADPRWTRIGLPILGLVIILGILGIGGEYYFAPQNIKETNEALQVYSPTGLWGQTVGVTALLFMSTNFLYFVRKEFTFMKHVGNIRTWMRVHVFSGLMTGMVALIHSVLYMRNLFGAALYVSLAVVVVTGLIGRYIYGFVPLDPRGRPLAHASLVALNERMALEFGRLYRHIEATAELRSILNKDEQAASSIPAMIYRLGVWWPLRYLKVRGLIRQASQSLDDPKQVRLLSRYCGEMLKLRFQMDSLTPLKQLLGLWRTSHAVLAFFLIILVTMHVAIVFWVGYQWIF